VISRALVAAAVATLLQLRRTLRSAEAFLEALSPRLDRTLEVAGRAVAMAVRALGIGRRSAPAGQPEPGEPDA